MFAVINGAILRSFCYLKLAHWRRQHSMPRSTDRRSVMLRPPPGQETFAVDSAPAASRSRGNLGSLSAQRGGGCKWLVLTFLMACWLVLTFICIPSNAPC